MTTTRISTNMSHLLSTRTMLELQADIQKTQQQLTTGKRLLTAADDPAASAAILSMNATKDTTAQYQKNAESALSRLEFQESVYSDVTLSLQRVKELTVQANNDTQSTETRALISRELEQILDHVTALGNTRDSNNEYLFSGNQVETQPFTRTTAGYVYNGDEGQRNIKVGASRYVAVSDTGKDVFMRVPSGNGAYNVDVNDSNTGNATISARSSSANFIEDDYTVRIVQAVPADPVTYEVLDGAGGVIQSGLYNSGESIQFNGALVTITGDAYDGDEFTVTPSNNQSIFQTIENVINTLAIDTEAASDRAVFHTRLEQSMASLEQAMFSIDSSRASIGARINTIDDQKVVNDNLVFQNTKAISGLEDLDMLEAITKFQFQMQSFQAAQQSYARSQGTSLFDYI